MIIGCLEVEVFIPTSQSLKDKRSVLQSTIRRCRHRFNAGVSEIEHQNLRQRAAIAAVVIGGSQVHAETQLQEILSLLEKEDRWEICRTELTYY